MARQRLEPGPTASVPCSPNHYAMGIIGMEFLTNFREIIKIFGTTETRIWTYCLRNFCPNPTAVIYFWIKRVGNFELKEKEKWPYWMNNFSCILHMRRKIITEKHCLLPSISPRWNSFLTIFLKLLSSGHRKIFELKCCLQNCGFQLFKESVAEEILFPTIVLLLISVLKLTILNLGKVELN